VEYPLYGRLDYRLKRIFKKLGIIIVTSPLVALVVACFVWIARTILRKPMLPFFPLWCATVAVECFIFIAKYPLGPYIWLTDEGLYVAKGNDRILISWTDVRNVAEYLHNGQRGIRLTFDDVQLWEIRRGISVSRGSFHFDYCYDITPRCNAKYWREEEPPDYDSTYEEECECASYTEHIRTGMPHYLFIPDIFSAKLSDIYQRMQNLLKNFQST